MVTEDKVEKALLRMNPKAPGRDAIPAFVWKEFWLVTKHHITAAF